MSRDERQPRRARAGLGCEIALELGVGQRAQPAEQVELEARDADAGLIIARRRLSSVCRRRSTVTPAFASSVGELAARAGFDIARAPPRCWTAATIRSRLLASACAISVCSRGSLEHLRVGQRRKAGFGLRPDKDRRPATTPGSPGRAGRSSAPSSCSASASSAAARRPLHACASPRRRNRSRMMTRPSRTPRRTST